MLTKKPEGKQLTDKQKFVHLYDILDIEFYLWKKHGDGSVKKI